MTIHEFASVVGLGKRTIICILGLVWILDLRSLSYFPFFKIVR